MTTTLRTIVVLAAAITLCSGSAIPMWEFLSRGEKMSHLYSMFAKQVSAHCKSNGDVAVAECKRELLVYGVDKLGKMSDSHLDSMDPYQRGANDIIWDSMMDGHRTKPSKKHNSAPTQIRVNIGQYAPNPLFAGTDTSGGAADDAADPADHEAGTAATAYAMGMDNTYSSYNYPTAVESMMDSGRQPQNHLEPAAATSLHLNFDRPSGLQQQSIANNFLNGPMVFRVRPDGTPVEEDNTKPLPRDDDREAMTIGKEKIPTAQQINNNFNGSPVMPNSRHTTLYASYRATDRRFRN